MSVNPKTIVLWGRGDLLSSSVELFLSTQKGWHVINLPNDENPETLVMAVDELKPDAVIIHQQDHDRDLSLPASLLQLRPGLKVIIVNQENNILEVYGRQNITAKSAADLITAVEADMLSSIG